MKVDIDRFGLKGIEVDPATVFEFPQGLQGFEKSKQFKIFHDDKNPSVFFLQALDDGAATFPIVTPETLSVEYVFELSDEESASIGLTSPEDAAVFVILYRVRGISAEGGQIAANSQSPVVLNMKTRKGLQKVLYTSKVMPWRS